VSDSRHVPYLIISPNEIQNFTPKMSDDSSKQVAEIKSKCKELFHSKPAGTFTLSVDDASCWSVYFMGYVWSLVDAPDQPQFLSNCHGDHCPNQSKESSTEESKQITKTPCCVQAYGLSGMMQHWSADHVFANMVLCLHGVYSKVYNRVSLYPAELVRRQRRALAVKMLTLRNSQRQHIAKLKIGGSGGSVEMCGATWIVPKEWGLGRDHVMKVDDIQTKKGLSEEEKKHFIACGPVVWLLLRKRGTDGSVLESTVRTKATHRWIVVKWQQMVRHFELLA
jgi:hypothetical protein